MTITYWINSNKSLPKYKNTHFECVTKSYQILVTSLQVWFRHFGPDIDCIIEIEQLLRCDAITGGTFKVKYIPLRVANISQSTPQSHSLWTRIEKDISFSTCHIMMLGMHRWCGQMDLNWRRIYEVI